jgi:hypothetical protein
MGAMTRADLVVHLRDALLREVSRLDLPDDGAHLSRLARAMVHIAATLLMSRLPSPVAYHVILRAAAKAIRNHDSMPNVGLLGPLPPGSACR